MSADKPGDFPHPPREHPRVRVEPQVPLHCVADAGGITPFDAALVDISESGIGFITYAPDINLAPGTLLRGCRVGLPDGRTVEVDLEVRYSQPITADNGRPASRAGCRIVEPTTSLLTLIRQYLGT